MAMFPAMTSITGHILQMQRSCEARLADRNEVTETLLIAGKQEDFACKFPSLIHAPQQDGTEVWSSCQLHNWRVIMSTSTDLLAQTHVVCPQFIKHDMQHAQLIRRVLWQLLSCMFFSNSCHMQGTGLYPSVYVQLYNGSREKFRHLWRVLPSSLAYADTAIALIKTFNCSNSL